MMKNYLLCMMLVACMACGGATDIGNPGGETSGNPAPLSDQLVTADDFVGDYTVVGVPNAPSSTEGSAGGEAPAFFDAPPDVDVDPKEPLVDGLEDDPADLVEALTVPLCSVNTDAAPELVATLDGDGVVIYDLFAYEGLPSTLTADVSAGALYVAAPFGDSALSCVGERSANGLNFTCDVGGQECSVQLELQ